MLAYTAAMMIAPSLGIPAQAQIPMPITTDSETEFRSLRVGSLAVTPSLAAGIGYDDNIISQPTNRRPDGVLRFAPTVTAASDWTRHAFYGEAAVEPFVYFNNSRLNDVNARVVGAGRLDLERGTTINTSASFFRSADAGVSPLTAAALPGGGLGPQNFDPLVSNRYNVDIRYQRQVNRLVFSGAFNFQRATYEQAPNAVTNFNQTLRDGSTYTFPVRVGYEIGAGIQVFGEASYNIRRYRLTSFDSEGARAVVGASLDVNRRLRGEAFVGYLHQTFTRGLPENSGVTFGANLRWTPTQRIAYTLQLRRDVSDPSVVGQRPGTSTLFGIGTELELYRNLLFNGAYTFINTDYSNTPADRIHAVAVGPTWIVNRRMRVTASYRYQSRQASFATSNYDRNLFLLQMRVGF